MYLFRSALLFKTASFCAIGLLPTVSSLAQNAPEVTRPTAALTKPQMLTYAVRCPNGKTASIRLERLPDSAVIRDNDNHWATARAHQRLSPTDTEIYNVQLNYSHRSDPDFLWSFPTRGYDKNTETQTYQSPYQSLIYTTDTYHGQDNKTYPYMNFGAYIELIEIGQPVQISTLREAIYPVRQYPSLSVANPRVPEVNDPPIGGEVAIIFWDGVFNSTQFDSGNPTNGLPLDSTGSFKFAVNANGANGFLVKIPTGGGVFVMNFDSDGTGKGRFRITDAQGRIGMTIASVYDPAYIDANSGQQVTSKEDGALLEAVAPNGKNRFYVLSDANFNPADGSVSFDPMDGNAGVLYSSDANLFALDGSVAFQTMPADALFNPGEAGGSAGSTYLVAPPYNTYTLLYGTKLNGTTATTGELRGRIRRQGWDPDNAGNITKVPSPYNSTTPVPGERKVNRFRFTFISPPLSASDIKPKTLWDPLSQLPAKYKFFQQECYAQPSYGDNADYTYPMSGTPIKLNYRFRGIPTGTYSILVQAIPIVDFAVPPFSPPGTPPTYLTDMINSYDQFPGSDFAPAFYPSVVIGPSQYVPPANDLTNRNYDYYTNTTTLDIKLHRPADGSNGTAEVPDGVVDIADLGILVNAYSGDANITGSGYDLAADFNGDGVVDISDFSMLINEYNADNGDQVLENATYQ